jgi:hypothetical protein
LQPAISEENDEPEETDREMEAFQANLTAYSRNSTVSLHAHHHFQTEEDTVGLMAYHTAVDAYDSVIDLKLVDEYVEKKGNKTKQLNKTSGIFNVHLPPPNTIDGAMASSNWDVPYGYKYATERECSAWVKQEVLKDAKTIPDDLKALNVRLLYTHKTDKKGRFQRAKLRIVIMGHCRAVVRGEHFFENFAHTAKFPNLRACCAQACLEGFTIARQWDTNAAFLYAKNEPGTRVMIFVPENLRTLLGVTGPYAWVIKAVYGLPSAPRGFFKYARKALENAGCHVNIQDEAIMTCRRGTEYIFICMWVDDYLVLSNSQCLYDEVYKSYFSQVDGEDGELDYMLGLNIDVSIEDQTIKLYSEKQIRGIIERYGTPQRASQVPSLPEDADLPKEPLPEIDSPLYKRLRERAIRYRSQVPSMLYVASTTRPDIAYKVGVLCRCLDNPSERHLDAADLCMAYLATTPTLGVQYGRKDGPTNLETIYSGLKDELEALSDSDWSTGHSISGFVLFMAGAPVLWVSKKQPVTSLSSAEAEYYAASACGADVIAMRLFMDSLGAPLLTPTLLHVDNSACVDLAKDFSSCKRAKHIDRRVNFLTDYHERGDIQVVPISTKLNTADIFTKPLAKPCFLKHRDTMMI